eukprot:TRINITY_DN8797_c0_g1_i2.p1 TRINITY_DN8797_c0_g1~~TRINITY_DN8797_c0_g1_i2.p1  ORF type:complete len:549 (-),score=100.61 TRINITY_DN8797_c0_g1_i2:189-1835(-)
MLASLLCTYTDAVNRTEAQDVSRLVDLYRDLIMEDGDGEGSRMDTKSEAGFNNTARFLEAIEVAAKAMGLEPSARAYRQEFTINYRALFPDEARNYRVDILEASVEQHAVIWVNGDKFEFSEEAMSHARELQVSWRELGDVLDRWYVGKQQRNASALPSRSELKSVLHRLDATWASFEWKYISELIAIEDRARHLVVDAVESEKRLQQYEEKYGETDTLQAREDYRSEQTFLVTCISRLNSVANFKRKGRDDLSVEVLWASVTTLQGCMRAPEKSEYMGAAKMLSMDVVESFVGMRRYLQEISSVLERVDPHLCNNVGLVAKLVDWEESWEVGTRYVQNRELMTGLCDLVSEIRCAQRSSSAFMEMCEDMDVELFFVIPRFVLLRMLYKQELQKGTIMTLMPQRFTNCVKDVSSGEIWDCDEELHDLVRQFRLQFQASYTAILDAQAPRVNGLPVPEAAAQVAWEVLTKRVVHGSEQKDRDKAYRCLAPAIRPAVEAAIESFLKHLEPFSMELQRRSPEDWNSFMSTLLECLQGKEEKKDVDHEPFQV